MNQSKERMQALENEYQSMPHGPARLAAIRAAVSKADQQMDHYWRMQHRYREMLEQMFHGDQGMILPLAGQIVTMFEEIPLRAFLNQYLYTLYAAVEVWDFLPQLPMEQWRDMMTHFWNAAQRYQCGHRQYYEIAFIRAIRQGRKEDAVDGYQNWMNASTPDITSCKACKQYLRVFYAVECADADLADRMARPLLDGSLACDQEPARTLGVLLDFALDRGDWEQAAAYAARLHPYLLKESREPKYNAPMLRWLAYEAPEDGLRMLERAVLPQLTLWDQKARFAFYRAAWILCGRLARRGAPLELDLPKEYPLWREDGWYDAVELADWFYQEARKIARAFDTRDGYPFFAQSLEKAGRFFDWLREKEKGLGVDSVEIELGRECDIDAWMKLVDSVKDSFPGLETREALEEHRNTVLDFMSKGSAICAKSNHKIVGTLLFSRENSLLCFLAVDDEYRRQHIAEKMVAYMLTFMDPQKDVVVTTHREGAAEGIAARAFYKRQGFVEGRLTEEFGSPVQEFILKR